MDLDLSSMRETGLLEELSEEISWIPLKGAEE